MRPSISLLAGNLLAVQAATVTYNWSVDWVWAKPDGFGRPVIGINKQWPPPPIEVNLGDQIIINLTNNLKNETTALHFHGPNQKGSAQQEGAAFVSQCPQTPGSTFVYNFTAANTGTHWYHSHIGGQYLDGFRGPLIIRDAAAPYFKSFDTAYTMSITDWYHQQAPDLLYWYQTKKLNKRGQEPVPDSTLINDSQDVTFDIVPGKTYLFRIINMGAFATNVIRFEGHNMTIVEMDGVATVPTVTDKIKIHVAQRYLVLVTALPTAEKNFQIISAMDPMMFNGDLVPAKQIDTAYGFLVYDKAAPLPTKNKIDNYDAIDEFNVLPFDRAPINGPVTQRIVANFDFAFIDGVSRGTMNGTTYLPPVTPTLYTAMSAPLNLTTDPRIYGPNSNTVVFNNTLGIAEIVINNFDSGPHPFHVHGHIAQVVARGAAGTATKQTTFDGNYAPIPMRRDVFNVAAFSYTIIRFKTGNPGIWLLHCHIEWHIEAGLTMTLVEDPIQIQEQKLFVPKQNYDVCAKQKIPITGNAAGNSQNWYDFGKVNKHPFKNNWGALINDDDTYSSKDSKIRRWAGRFKW